MAHRFHRKSPKSPKSAQKGGTPLFGHFSVRYHLSRPCCRRFSKKSAEPPLWTILRGGGAAIAWSGKAIPSQNRVFRGGGAITPIAMVHKSTFWATYLQRKNRFWATNLGGSGPPSPDRPRPADAGPWRFSFGPQCSGARLEWRRTSWVQGRHPGVHAWSERAQV